MARPTGYGTENIFYTYRNSIALCTLHRDAVHLINLPIGCLYFVDISVLKCLEGKQR